MPRRPLRICHIAYSFYESDNRVMRYVQTLAERGERVDVISLRSLGRRWRETVGPVSLYQIQRRSKTEKSAWTYLVKILWFWLKAMTLASVLQLRRRYDVVHVHNVPDFLVFAAWLPKLMGARLILDIHDIVPELYAGKFHGGRPSQVFRLLTTMERVCCAFADHVIVSNHLWFDKLTSRAAPACKCSTFLNYPDLSVFRPLPAGRGHAPFVILYPGSLNHHQGVDIALRAFASVRHEMPEAAFHIYGRGPALNSLVSLAHDLGVDGSVRFMDYLSMTRIAEVMASAAVGVVPKRADGFGNEAFSTKILEFMACGVPVIASRTLVDEYYFNDGLLTFFEAGSMTSLADALLQTYKHRNEQHEKVTAAREFAVQNSWQARCADYRSLIDSLATDSLSR